MKYLRFAIIPIIALAIGITISCERDDICPESTPTTPRLVIDLYDFQNQENRKNVFNLVVGSLNTDNELNIVPGYSFITSNNLVLPLNTNENSTQYNVIKDASLNDNGTPDDTSDDFIEGNIDVITINYTREEVYVSRACGYKTIFDNVEVVIQNDSDNWLLSRTNLTNNEPIENENATHFNIFH